MPAGNAHRLLQTMFDAFTPNIGAGLLKDPGSAGSIVFDKWGQVCLINTTPGGARTLPVPTRAGILAGIVLETDGGDLTLTVTDGYNEDADTSITMDTAGNYIVVWSIKVGTSYLWRVIAQEGTDATVEEIAADTATIQEVAKPAAVTAEHGAGAIGTGTAPTTQRYTRDGTIITEILIDLTGLDSSGVENDVIGLADPGTGAAYLGRNVVATNGIIYKVEMTCLEVPTAGDADILLVQGSAADEKFDDTVANTATICDGTSDWVLGETIVNNAPAITANYYYYLTQGATDNAAYTAGQYMIRFYGHAAIA